MSNEASITVTTRTIELAELGPESPLPAVQPLLEPPYAVDGGIPAEIVEGARWGKAKNIFPYTLQDAYTRETNATELTAVVLENVHLKATFLPQLGGRLWQLSDKDTGKELLHTGDRIQFANLALRNAWFAGGIEWNIGTRGHSPTTCSPLHTAIVHTPDGQPVLRMWEFDRLREVVFQIDAWLPAGSKVLFTAVRIRNPNDRAVPMYWWSNAAIPQTPETRVIAPAARAYATGYDGAMTVVAPTDFHGIDATWPACNTQAADFFFDLAPDQRRWEVAMDREGDGLALVSSPRLRGRKLFVWGESAGGHRWQEWLTPTVSGEPRRYAEIQSGLAQTQFEHVSMPAAASWQWVEAHGNAGLDPAVAGGAWEAAIGHAGERVDALVSAAAVDAALADACRWADLAPSEFVVAGSGWGALERARRRASGVDWIDESGTPFADETLTADQAPWLDLLTANAGIVEKPFEASVAEEARQPFGGAGSFVRGLDWEDLLAAARNESAEAAFHNAVMVHARADFASAADMATVASLYRRALGGDAGAEPDAAVPDGAEPDGAEPDADGDRPDGIAGAPLGARSRALARRGLGLALMAAGDTVGGLLQLSAACRADPGNRALILEAATLAVNNGRPQLVFDVLGMAPASVQALGQAAFLRALAHAELGDAAAAAAILKTGMEVPDLREGANSITDLWRRVCPGEDVPERYQFSMR
ncbi:DUF5107 domain-containing protein [Arthrobacter wenxiniae]|uniref:DUF5107 domain-containing protein n=1 Tax=Arthrobacter wenxiniae TaxID=2713570 RepID=A0A7Y7IE12_9MICC|nr:DUF5107 domain-containing protein [Arthrobacter wenxiniae]NVM93769.1 DUF5107 domain-containing protein [Arthrobacter wenxiniae]